MVAQPVLAQPVPRGADLWAGDGGVTPFYRWTGAAPSLPGMMLRTETLPAELSLAGAGRAERILYSATNWLDARAIETVSGAVFFPKGAPPVGGWPVIAWAHGTTGVADVCAPSFNPRSLRDQQYLSAWLEAGYAVVATDYAGLGAPGPHPYLQSRSEGIAVLDSVRAVLKAYPGLLANKVVTMGQSQGSGAAIAAAWLAPTYAPELKIKGTVATGLVAHTNNTGGAPQEAIPSLYTDRDAGGNAAYEILYFLGTARSVDPKGVRAEDYISEAGWPLLEKAQTTCMGGLRAFARDIALPVDKLYKRPIDALEAKADALSDFPDVKIPTPVFVGTGLADSDAQTVSQYNFVSAMCAAGNTVEWRYYPRATHASAVMRSRADSPAFVEKVLHDKPVANLCPSLVPPGPLQDPED
ncbi:lipase family protein [Caulobacter hibisci]|uniref:Lipase n=1 Tax=Caulobacter hibisci TaxID=2035993 RepID=A0ABS0SYL7_9CAUL|nr:lipase family protein [Caulobacter hibisci]MBI1683773.1 lipase [Caulobacter hibisci]